MQLITHTQFARRYFAEGSRPSKAAFREWVETGELHGRVIGNSVFIDENRFIGQSRPVQISSVPNLLD